MITWKYFIDSERTLPYYVEMKKKIDLEYETQVIFPKKENIYSSFKYCPYDQLKVVIIGQDPYHGENQAHGMSFSVLPGVKIPPSLRNIYKELESDVGARPVSHGYLLDWAKQGVLLMNTSLTVRQGQPGSHKNIGWAMFTQHVLEVLNMYPQPLVFILWGSHAINIAKAITNPNHVLIKSVHPSPLAASGGFFGSKPFSKTNEVLIRFGKTPIDWQLKELRDE